MKIHEIFYEIRELFLLFYNVYKEKMFKIQIQDGREAPKNPIKLKKNSNKSRHFCKYNKEIKNIAT